MAKRWEQLTEAGKFRRLRPLALAALRHYDLEPLRLRLVGGFTNAIFRVDTADGPLALRIDYLQEHPDESAEVEAAWLDALANDTDLDVVRLVHARSGEPFVREEAVGVPGARRCTLFEWIPGRPLEDHMTPTQYRRLGSLSARLHLHGATFQPPRRPMAMDTVFYWPTDPIVYRLPEHAHHFTGDRLELLERTIAAVEPAYARLDPGGAQIIHADLHMWNVHVYRNRMIALDFEDVAWGHPVQDVAITLFYGRSDPRYPALRAAFEEGYRTVAPWPVEYPGQLEQFMAARTVMFINFVLNMDDGPTDFFDHAFERLRSFLDTWA